MHSFIGKVDTRAIGAGCADPAAVARAFVSGVLRVDESKFGTNIYVAIEAARFAHGRYLAIDTQMIAAPLNSSHDDTNDAILFVAKSLATDFHTRLGRRTHIYTHKHQTDRFNDRIETNDV